MSGVLKDNRICYNCGCRVVSNPDNPKKWIHHSSGEKKCRLPDPERGNTAQPAKIHLDDDIIMVSVNNRIYRRDAHFFPDFDNRQDLWSDWRQGASRVTIEDLLNMGDVFVVTLGRQL